MDWAAGTNRNNGYYDTATTMSTHVTDPTDPSQWNLFLDFPLSSYTEIVWRSNTNATPATSDNQPVVDWWTWTAAWYAENINAGYCTGSGHPSCTPLEIDFIEDWGTGGYGVGFASFHNYQGGGAGGVAGGQPGQFYDPTIYNRLGVLVTSDGATDIKSCVWVGPESGTMAFQGCGDFPQPISAVGVQRDGGGGYDGRAVLVLWYGAWTGPGTTNIAVPLHFWIKSIGRWECVDWQRGSTGPNPHCFGEPSLTTGPDGSQYYKVTTQ
jgi:hypothetical protein